MGRLLGTRRLRAFLLASLAIAACGLGVAAANVRVPVLAPASVEAGALRGGDSGQYGFFDASQALVGVLRFRVDSADGQPIVVYGLEEGGRSTVVTESIDPATAQVSRRSTRSTLAGFEETVTAFGAAAPALPGLESTGARLVDGRPTGNHPLAAAWPRVVIWQGSASGPQPVQVDLAHCAVETATGRLGSVGDKDVTEVVLAASCGAHTYRRSLWYADGAPLPEVADYETRGPAGGGSLTLGLSGFRRGDGPETRWDAGAGTPALPPLQSAPLPLRSGDGEPFAYPLEDAVQDVQEDLTLVGYHLWRHQNPDAVLASARLTRGEHATRDADSDGWRLVFARPDGAAYEVVAERAHATGATRTGDRGAAEVEPFRPGDLPPALPTLSAAAQRWREAAGPLAAGLRVNLAQWGLPVPLSWAPDCQEVPSKAGLLPLEVGWSRVAVGHSTFGSCMDPKFVRTESYALLDAAGTPLLLVEHELVLADFPDGQVPRASQAAVSTGAGLALRAPDLRVAAATASLLALLWTLYFLPALKALAGRAWIPAYSRVEPGGALGHPVRQSIVDAVRADPSVTASELARRLSLGWGNLDHHVRVLAREGLVTSAEFGRHRHFFPGGTPAARQKAAAVVRQGTARAVFDLVRERPGLSMEEVAAHVGVTPAGALWHVRLLEDAGLVRRVRDGKRKRCFPVAPAPPAAGP